MSYESLQRFHLSDIPNYNYLRGGLHLTTREGAIDIDRGGMKTQFENLMQCMVNVGFTAVIISGVVVVVLLFLGAWRALPYRILEGSIE